MEYIQGLSFQTRLFFQSIGFGFLLGILYGLFGLFRIIFSERKTFVIVMDILYFTLCGFLIFCFALVTDNGEIRAYLLAGNLIGWLIFYFSMSFISARIRILKKNICRSKLKKRKNEKNFSKKSKKHTEI